MGNVQKVLLGREIKSGPNVIVTAYPVRGLDINSSYAIYDILNKEKGKRRGHSFSLGGILMSCFLCVIKSWYMPWPNDGCSTCP